VGGDLFHLRFVAESREQLAGSGHDPLAIAACVGA
jgi:hypothetical protein